MNVSINKSNLADVKRGVLQGSILGIFFSLFTLLIYTYSEVDHFADDYNLPKFNSCVNSINKHVNYNLKNLSN